MPDASAPEASTRRPTTRPLVLPGAEPFFYPRGTTGCLLLHGLSSSPFTLREMGAALAAQDITVAAPLLAGHGTSPEDLRTKTWQDWVASAETGLHELHAHGCTRIFLAGLSLGGALSLYLAERTPDAFAGVITMSAPIWIPPLLSVPLQAVSGSLPYLGKRFSDIADPAARARQLTYQQLPLTAAAALIDLLARVQADLPRITAPALIIYSRHDHLVRPMNAMWIYSRIASRDKQLRVLHRSYHIVTVDYDKEQVFALAADFIRAHA